MPEAILAALDPEQRQAGRPRRSRKAGLRCWPAYAGTGKTRAVAHRIAYLVATGQISPGRVLAVTFTTRAAGELRGRLRQLGALRALGPAWSRCRRAHSTPRRCASSPTSGRRRSVASRRGCWTPRSACWPRQRAGPGSGLGLDRAARRGRRDRVGQGHPGPAGRLRDREQQRGPVRPVRRRDPRPAVRRVRGTANRAQPGGLRSRCWN